MFYYINISRNINLVQLLRFVIHIMPLYLVEVCHLLRSERAALSSRAIKRQSRVIHEILRGLMINK